MLRKKDTQVGWATVFSRADFDGQNPLDNDDITPYAVQLGVLFVYAHLAKAL